MEQSILTAIERLEARHGCRAEVREILLDFYKDRTIEILIHLDSHGVGQIFDETEKIGLTD